MLMSFETSDEKHSIHLQYLVTLLSSQKYSYRKFVTFSKKQKMLKSSQIRDSPSKSNKGMQELKLICKLWCHLKFY